MKFSIIIPVYNGEPHLQHAMQSILPQDFTDWEAIIVDDGSTDATPQIAEALASQDSRIRVVHQSNGGVSIARNHGMDEAQGDWIVWLDADDSYVDGALGQIAAMADRYSACNCMQFPYQKGNPDGSFHPCIPEAYSTYGGQVHPGQQAFRILFAHNGLKDINWQPWRFVYRRDSLPRFRERVIHEDVDVLPLHMATFSSVYIAQEAFYVYQPAREGAATTIITPKRVWDILDVTAHVYGTLQEAQLPPDLKRNFQATLAFNLFGYYLATPSFAEQERSRLLKAFADHPEWLLAIGTPPRTAWLKRLLLRLLGVRQTAILVNRLQTLSKSHRNPTT